MRVSVYKTLFYIFFLTLLLLISIYLLPSQPFRMALGIAFLLFFPGFTFLAILAPHRKDMSAAQRIILSLVLSIALDSLIGLVLHYTAFGITVNSVSVTSSVLVIAMSVVGMMRQAGLPEEERSVVELRLTSSGHTHGVMNSALTIVMVLVIGGAIAAGGYFTFAPKNIAPFTQFYIMEQGEGAFYSPADLAAGDEARVSVAIVNHEGGEADYEIRVLLNGESYTRTSPVMLADGEQWQDEIDLMMKSSGQNRVEFLLFKDSGTEPYLKPLTLWLDVEE